MNEAVGVLSDDTKRQQYDQFGSEGMKNGFGGSSGGFGGGFGGFGGSQSGFDMNDIFESFFGGGFGRGGSRSRGPRQGADLRYDLEITLQDVANGLDKSLKLKKDVVCDDCEGAGGTGKTTCSHCGGSGIVESVQRTPFGMFKSQQPCPHCNGVGSTVEHVCDTCGGKGSVHKAKTIKIQVPAGVKDGVRLRVEGEGEPGEPGAQPGDLYVFIHVQTDENFSREGDDLYLSVPITFSQAVLGDTIKVPTITGSAELKVPSGTQPGTLLRMKGKGLPRMRSSGAGDQYVKILVEVPKNVNKKQKDFIEQFEQQTKGKKPHQRFFDMLRGK